MRSERKTFCRNHIVPVLLNLNERVKLITGNEIVVFERKDEFIVKLPLRKA